MRVHHAAVPAVWMAACSLLTNLDDLRQASGDATQADVASDVSPTDASPNDGGTATDGDSAVPLTSFCLGVDAAFCDDFEEGGSFVPPWTAVNTQASGTLVRAFVDGGCLSVSLGTGDAAPNAFLQKTLVQAATKIHYAFDLQVVAYPTSSSGTANVNQLYLPLADAGNVLVGYVYLALSQASSRLVEQHHYLDGSFSPQVSSIFPSLTPGSWSHFDVIVDLGAGTASVGIDGADAGSLSLPASIYGSGAPMPTAGVTFETVSSDHFALLVDNTVVWLE